MMSNIKKYIYRNWANISGWTTKRKIVMKESKLEVPHKFPNG